VLVTAEVALSLVLLAGAGLMLQSFWNLVGVDTGMEGDQVVQVTIRMPPRALGKYPGREGHIQMFNLMRDRVEAIPGVTSFARAAGGPLSDEDLYVNSITIPGRPRLVDENIDWWFVSQGYFRTMGIRLLEGRTWERDLFANEATYLRMGPVVINEAMAKAVWPGESALGKLFFPEWVDPDGASELLDAWRRATEDQKPDGWAPWQVIGVVADTRSTLEREPRPLWYTAHPGGNVLLVRTSLDPASLGQVLRHEIEAVDPNEIEVLEIRTMEQIVAERSADSRFRALLVVFFAVMATGITVLGLFGVLTYAVAQRTHELGIRMALGAGNSQIAGLVLSQGARMVGLGVALGFALVVWLTRYISSLLFGVAPLDPMTLAGVAALIFALALVATYLPARRAMGVDPIAAMRQD